MKRYLPIAILLITVGFGCEECDDYANSILEDLYPEKYPNNSTSNSNNSSSSDGSILKDLYPERYNQSTTSLWVNSTDLNINESGTEASWGLQIVEGTATASSTGPVVGVNVTVEFQGGSGEEEVIGVTGAEQMYITGIAGDFPWNSLDNQFWQNTPALSMTAEESQ